MNPAISVKIEKLHQKAQHISDNDESKANQELIEQLKQQDTNDLHRTMSWKGPFEQSIMRFVQSICAAFNMMPAVVFDFAGYKVAIMEWRSNNNDQPLTIDNDEILDQFLFRFLLLHEYHVHRTLWAIQETLGEIPFGTNNITPLYKILLYNVYVNTFVKIMFKFADDIKIYKGTTYISTRLLELVQANAAADLQSFKSLSTLDDRGDGELYREAEIKKIYSYLNIELGLKSAVDYKNWLADLPPSEKYYIYKTFHINNKGFSTKSQFKKTVYPTMSIKYFLQSRVRPTRIDEEDDIHAQQIQFIYLLRNAISIKFTMTGFEHNKGTDTIEKALTILCQENNLQPYYKRVFRNDIWLCIDSVLNKIQRLLSNNGIHTTDMNDIYLEYIQERRTMLLLVELVVVTYCQDMQTKNKVTKGDIVNLLQQVLTRLYFHL
jgi:hypothetical protein